MESSWITVVGEWCNNYFPIILLLLTLVNVITCIILWKIKVGEKLRFIASTIWISSLCNIEKDKQLIELLNQLEINSRKNKELISSIKKHMRTEEGLAIVLKILEKHNFSEYDGGSNITEN